MRFRDLRLSSYTTVDELLQDAVRVAPLGEHPPAPSEPLFGRDRLAETAQLGRADICRTVLILDGWDEVALTGSVRFKQQIDELLPRLRERFVGGAGPPMRVLLTGRPSAVVDRSGVLRRETPVLTIRPLRPQQVRRYAAQIAGHLDGADWHLDLDRCERALARYEASFDGVRTGGTDVLGLPLLALLAFRTIAEWQGDVDELFARSTALYSALVDVTAEHAGKAEPGPQGTVHRGGRTLRRLLQRVASVITALGTESVSFAELERRLEDDDALRDWARQATDDNSLHELVVNFYFKGHAELGCEFLHKSFREYLFAEAVIATLEAASTGRAGPHAPPAREWGADFTPGSVHHQVSRSLASLLGPQWLTPEVRNHLFWLVERAATGPQRQQWVWIRDLLNDVWGWWGEGVHLRVHPERRKGRDDCLPPPVVELLEEASPVERRDWTYSPSTATIDAHLGDALLHLTAFVHEHIADQPTAGERGCQTRGAGWVGFRPFNSADAQSLLARLAAARGRPDGHGLSHARLRAVDLSGEDLTSCFLVEADLSGARLQRLRAPFVIANAADLSRADLGHAILHQGRFHGADLRSASLVGAVLTEAYLVSAHLGCVNLSDADLTDANLTGAFLRRANLTGAILHRINLREAHLGSADLSGANLTEAQLIRANLTGAQFRVAHLGGANLAGANLEGANLRGADLTDANLTGANLSGADLTDANLTGANLSGANLAEANLTDTDLTGANLAGANLLGADRPSLHPAVVGPVRDDIRPPTAAEPSGRRVHEGQSGRSTRERVLLSGSRKLNMGGTPGQRITAGSVSTPRACNAAWSASASSVVRRMPVSTPIGDPSGAGARAMVVAAPGGDTSAQRMPGANSASIRTSKPSLPA